MTLTQISTAGIKNDAVNHNKIPDNAIGASELANDSVDTNAIQTDAVTTTKILDENVTLAKLEHGTPSNDGKFLRANNGADPTFETVTIPPGIPSGGIIIWSGASNLIGSTASGGTGTGWVICDGQNNTPDLRDRFVVGAGSTYSVADTGGAVSVSDTVSISGSGTTAGYNAETSGGGSLRRLDVVSSQANRQHTHDFSFSGSGTATIDTRSPYYALCYIMKT